MRKSAMLAGALSLAVTGIASADVYGPGAGGAIPDRAVAGVGPPTGSLTSTIALPAGVIASLNNVSLTFGTGTGATGAHTWVGDLEVTLTSPGGDNVHLFSRPGANTATGFGNTGDMSGGPYVFVNSGGGSFLGASALTPVPTGTYNRETNNPLAPPTPNDPDTYAVFNGDSSGGNWTLTIEDWAGGDTGGLVSWSMDVTLVPEPGSVSLLAGAAALPLLRRRRR